MTWLWLSLGTLGLWGTYALFATRANAVHGELVTMAFEAAAMALIVVVQLPSLAQNIGRMTVRSAFDASAMGLMSAVGFYLLMRAIRIEPTRVGTMALITGLYPVITIVVAAVLGQQQMDAMKWIGAALAVTGLILVSI